MSAVKCVNRHLSIFSSTYAALFITGTSPDGHMVRLRDELTQRNWAVSRSVAYQTDACVRTLQHTRLQSGIEIFALSISDRLSWKIDCYVVLSDCVCDVLVLYVCV